MTREEAIAIIENEKECVNRANKNDYCNRDCYNCELVKTDTEILTALDMAIKALEREPTDDATLKDIFCMGCEYKEQEHSEDAISRKSVIDVIERWLECSGYNEAERHIMRAVQSVLYDSPSVTPQPKTGHWEKEAKAKTFDVLHFVADNAGISTFEAIEKAYNMGVSEREAVLDKIRAEIEQSYCKVENDYDQGRNYGLYMSMQILDKYKAESEET